MRVASLVPVLSVLFVCSAVLAQGRPRVELPLLTVSGTAETAAAPDRAILRVGAVAQAEQAAGAQAQVNEVVGKTLDALKQLGVPAEDLSTAGVSLSPVYSQPGPRDVGHGEAFTPKISAYRAENTVEVRLSDLKKVGPAIDAAVGAGANQVQSLMFDLKDDTEARSRALTDAVKQARAKAETLAQAAGVRLGALHELVEGGAEVQPIPFRGAVAMRAMAAPTPIEPGQLRVTASVTLRYVIVTEQPATK